MNAILQQVIERLRDWPVPAWLVGGTVRDHLLGRPVHDIDVAVPSGGLRLAQTLANALGAAYFPLDRARDVGRVVLRLGDGTAFVIDVARLRGSTLEADLFARDFSINAMAQDVRDPNRVIIDPVGGRDDLHARRLRMTSDRVFVDDPLRIVRGVRIAHQLQLTWEPATREQARLAAPRLDTIAGERVREELTRILATVTASHALRQLDDLDALAVLLPEIKALQGVTQGPPHLFDVYDHTLHAVDWMHVLLDYLDTAPDRGGAGVPGNLPADAVHGLPPVVRAGFDDALAPYAADLAVYLGEPAEQDYTRRDLLPWAAVLHDTGKPGTRRVLADGRITFEGHEAAGAVIARTVLARLHFSSEAVQRVTRICASHDRPHAMTQAYDGQADRRSIYRYFHTTRPAGVETALFSLADHLAAWGPDLRPARWSQRVQLVARLLEAFFRHYDEQIAPKALLDGTALRTQLHLAPGPLIGACLAALQEEQAAGTVTSLEEAWTIVRSLVHERSTD